MTEEDQERLNFYSKYTRAKEYQGIDSLYNLIQGAKSTSSLEIHIVSRNDHKSQLSRKASASPLPKKMTGSLKTKELTSRQDEEIERRNMEEINQKMIKLKKMERQFHQEMARRQSELRKRKQSRDLHRRQRQQYKNNLISVVENRQSSPPRKESYSSNRKLARDPEQYEVPSKDLDFQDYYRQLPEVKINSAYDPSPQVRKQIRQMIEIQKIREKEVQSVDEDENGKPTASIVLERIDIRGSRDLPHKPAQRIQSKNLCQVELSHSRSQNTLSQYRFGRQQDDEVLQVDQKPKLQQQRRERSSESQNNQQHSPVKHLHFDSHNAEYCRVDRNASNSEEIQYWSNSSAVVKQVESMEVIGEPFGTEHTLQKTNDDRYQPLPRIQQEDNEIYSEQNMRHSPIAVRNKTGTQEGSEFKEEIYDKVDPIGNRSQQFVQPFERHSPEGHLYHSQTNPSHRLQMPTEVQSIATESLDYHPLQEQRDSSSSKKRLENKKSSFKKLMAENRANLVPRMAISTILNEKINEALGDFKIQNAQTPASPNLQESIIKSEVSSPPTKRKVNFKRRIVEQQLDKSHSRESKPSFERDPTRVDKNRKLLVGFFADN